MAKLPHNSKLIKPGAWSKKIQHLKFKI